MNSHPSVAVESSPCASHGEKNVQGNVAVDALLGDLHLSLNNPESQLEVGALKESVFVLDTSGTPTVAITTADCDEERPPCTSRNWETFFSYNKKNPENGETYTCDPKEFQDRKTYESKSLTLTKLENGTIQLAIKSPYLQKQFRGVVDIENYNGVTLSASETILEYPFPPLFHHVEEMKTNVAADSEATGEDRSHMDALYYFATVGYPANLYADVKGSIEQGFITYENLWALYKPGDHILCKDYLRQPIPYQVSSVKKELIAKPDKVKSHVWKLTINKIIWKAGRFKKASSSMTVDKFSGTKRISDLEFYALSHHPSRDEIRKNAIAGGKAWKNYHQRDPMVMTYQGPAMPVFMSHVQNVTQKQEDSYLMIHVGSLNILQYL